MRTRVRVGLLVAFVVIVAGVARWTGLTELLTVDRIRTLGQEAGLWGAVAFVGAFTLGLFAQVPGWIFLSAAAVAYGPVQGAMLSIFAGIFGVTVTFCVVRAIGGEALSEVQHPRVRRLLDGLDRRPVRTIFLLRTFMMVSPPLNYALALSRTPLRAYVAGSAAGLVLPITVSTLVANCVLS